MSSWVSLEQARVLWPDAPFDDDTLTALLDAAQEVCEAFAPALDLGDPVPARYTQAVTYTARDTWTGRVANLDGDVYGLTGTYTPAAMSPQVRRLLRPDRGPMVG